MLLLPKHPTLVFVYVIYLFPTWQVQSTKEALKLPSICKKEVNYNATSEKHTMHYIDSALFTIVKDWKKPHLD